MTAAAAACEASDMTWPDAVAILGLFALIAYVLWWFAR